MFKRFLKFGIVGVFGTITHLIIFTLLNISGINYIISSIIAFIIAASSNYILNQIWVFKDRGLKLCKILWLKYMTICSFSLMINLLTLYIMETKIMPQLLEFELIKEIMKITAKILNINSISNVTAIYSQCIAIIPSMMTNFIGNNCITFKKK